MRINSQGGGASISDLLSQFGNRALSVSAWVNYSGHFIGHVRHEHIFFSTNNNTSRDMDLFAERPTSPLAQTFAWAQGNGTQFVTGRRASWVAAPNSWHHVVLGRDAVGTQYLCEDGAITGSNARGSNFVHSPAATFYLGRNTYDNGGRSFPGAIDDVKAYSGWVGAAGCAALYTDTCDE